MVPGLCELIPTHSSEAPFMYHTGPVWSVSELMRWLPRKKNPLYTRAGLEMCLQLATILVEASEIGSYEGVECHGGVSPLRLLFNAKGQASVIGYALPQISCIKYAEQTGASPVEALRYSPPERLYGTPEDIHSDLYSLVLVALEWITGEPLFRGTPSKVLQSASQGRGAEALYRFHDELPLDIVQAFSRTLRPERDTRYPHGDAFLETIYELLQSPIAEGPGLEALVSGAIKTWRRCQLLLPETPPEEPGQHVSFPCFSPNSKSPGIVETGTSPNPPDPSNRVAPPSNESERLKFLVLSETQPPTWVHLNPNESVAETTARLIDQLVGTPVNHLGQISGWYRLTQGEKTWFGNTPSTVLLPTLPIELTFISHQTALIRVQIADTPAPRLHQMEVSLTCPVHFILRSLKERFKLCGSEWKLVVHGEPLNPWQILHDYGHCQMVEFQLIR